MYMSLQCEDSPRDALITYTKETSISDEACLALKSQLFFNKCARKQYNSQVAESNTKKSKHQNNNALHAK